MTSKNVLKSYGRLGSGGDQNVTESEANRQYDMFACRKDWIFRYQYGLVRQLKLRSSTLPPGFFKLLCLIASET